MMNELSPAERHYKNHLKAVSNYQKKHPDKVNIKNIKLYAKIKETNPEKYNEILQQKKDYYAKNKDEIARKQREYYLKRKEKKELEKALLNNNNADL